MIKGKNYEITAQNIAGHELIGLGVKVIESADSGRSGIEGVVLDETQNTIVVLGKHGKEKKVFVLPKKECVFEFDICGEKVAVDGKKILRRPEDRVKEWRN